MFFVNSPVILPTLEIYRTFGPPYIYTKIPLINLGMLPVEYKILPLINTSLN
jgi:hypothetical protein